MSHSLADATEQPFPRHSLAKPGLVQGHPKHRGSRGVALPAVRAAAWGGGRCPSLSLGTSVLPSPSCPLSAAGKHVLLASGKFKNPLDFEVKPSLARGRNE